MRQLIKAVTAGACALSLAICVTVSCEAAETVLVVRGESRAVLVVDQDAGEWQSLAAEELRLHVREMSGAELPIENAPRTDGTVNVFVGSVAPEPGLDAIRRGGSNGAAFRLAVTGDSVQLTGLSEEAVLNAAYELLEQLGVRWFMPGEIGTVVPKRETVAITHQTTIQHPGFRGRHLQAIAAPAWARRLRLGGIDSGGHGLGPRFDRKKEPELFIHEDGKPTNQADVANPRVLERVVGHWLQRLEKAPDMETMRIGPEDGAGFGDNHPWDAGDMNPLDGKISVTDRYVKFFNMVLARINPRHPDVGLGFYAYGQCMSPPVREKPNPKLLPMLAPIDLCRIHTVESPHCWERRYMGKLIDGWRRTGVEMMYRGYYFNLCNPGIPYSMTRQIAVELPFFKAKGIIGCRVETMPAWAFHGPSLYLAAKMMWNPELDADALLDDYFATFYGPAGSHVQRYFDVLEAAYLEADYHTGNVFDAPKILTADILSRLGDALNAATSAVPADGVYAERVRMIHDGLRAGELILGTIAGLNACDFDAAKTQTDQARELLQAGMKQIPPRFHRSLGIGYFKRFWADTVDHGYECTHGGNEKVLQLPDEWQFMLDPYAAGEAYELWDPDIGDQPWQTIHTHSQSWSNQGLRYYKGDCWYRTDFSVPGRYRGRELVLWLGGVDNDPKVWLNGQELEMISKGASPIGRPWQYSATEAIRFDRENAIAIRVRNDRLRELGTGGLTGPAMIYAKAAAQ